MDGITSTTRTVNYDSKTSAVDSKTPCSFSIRIREIKRVLARNGCVRQENLVKQIITASSTIRFEIPSCFLGEEETCRGYVSYSLSKTIVATWIKPSILPQICKDAMKEGKRSGFMIEAQVEAVKETYFNNCIDLNDYDSEGQRIAAEPDCPICLQDFGEKIITKLRCCDHSFHRSCILTWLSRKPSCPTCRDDIHNPRPKKFAPKKVYF